MQPRTSVRLDALQRRVLVALAGTRPPWTLTGGGALAAVHLGHRATRDLDLFWRGLHTLSGIGDAIVARLRAQGLDVTALQTSPAFQQLRVTDTQIVVIVDLVADPVPSIDTPLQVEFDGVMLQVDTEHEILVNKLCALLGRSELRDLVDIRALLLHGLDLGRALTDAPRKDSGFSPLTLSWVLKQQPLHAMARASGLTGDDTKDMLAFREELIQRLMDAARPAD